jgi:hypothetical protein
MIYCHPLWRRGRGRQEADRVVGHRSDLVTRILCAAWGLSYTLNVYSGEENDVTHRVPQVKEVDRPLPNRYSWKGLCLWPRLPPLADVITFGGSGSGRSSSECGTAPASLGRQTDCSSLSVKCVGIPTPLTQLGKSDMVTHALRGSVHRRRCRGKYGSRNCKKCGGCSHGIMFSFLGSPLVAPPRACVLGSQEVIQQWRRLNLQIPIDDFKARCAGVTGLARRCPESMKLDLELIPRTDGCQPCRASLLGMIALRDWNRKTCRHPKCSK